MQQNNKSSKPDFTTKVVLSIFVVCVVILIFICISALHTMQKQAREASKICAENALTKEQIVAYNHDVIRYNIAVQEANVESQRQKKLQVP